jgi:hypothetical protein
MEVCLTFKENTEWYRIFIAALTSEEDIARKRVTPLRAGNVGGLAVFEAINKGGWAYQIY